LTRRKNTNKAYCLLLTASDRIDVCGMLLLLFRFGLLCRSYSDLACLLLIDRFRYWNLYDFVLRTCGFEIVGLYWWRIQFCLVDENHICLILLKNSGNLFLRFIIFFVDFYVWSEKCKKIGGLGFVVGSGWVVNFWNVSAFLIEPMIDNL